MKMLSCVCLCVFRISLNRKQSRRRNEKLLPPLLSPLSDDPPRKRTCDSSSSLSQEVGAAGILPCSTTSTSSSSSSSHRHRRGEGKVSSHTRNGSVSLLLNLSILLAHMFTHIQICWSLLVNSHVNQGDYYPWSFITQTVCEAEQHVFTSPHYPDMKPKYAGYECCHLAHLEVLPLQASQSQLSIMMFHQVFIASKNQHEQTSVG